MMVMMIIIIMIVVLRQDDRVPWKPLSTQQRIRHLTKAKPPDKRYRNFQFKDCLETALPSQYLLDILVELTNTVSVSVSEAKIHITLLILNRDPVYV